MEEDFGSWADVDSAENREKICILHVDDDPDFADLTSTFLERESDVFEVISGYSGADGLEYLSNEAVDCIVSDYEMPGQNGLEFYDSIPAEYAEIPFILYTGKGSEAVASEAFSLGVTDYLQKEGGTDQFTVLANRIEQAVSNYRAHLHIELIRRRFKTLVEESTDAIFVVDPSGTILYATPATNHILGRSPEDMVGTDGFEPIHTDDVTAVSEELEKLIEDSEYRAQVAFRYQHADGSWIWVEVRGRNLLDNNDINGIVVYARDVDVRKANELALDRQEETFRAVFEEASEAMVIVNDEGEYVEVNPAACRLFGLEEAELLGRSIWEFAPEEYDVDGVWERFQQSDRDRGLFPLVRADGERRLVEFSASRDILPNRHLSILREVREQQELSESDLQV